MGQFIVKLKEHYLMWSTIVDAPISEGMNLKQLKRWIRSRYGQEGINELPARLARVDKKGTSSFDEESAESTIWLNRAGPEERPMTIVGIYHRYCLGEDMRDEWLVPQEIADMEDSGGKLYDAVMAGWPEAQEAQP
jgi:hypothetical protein